MPSDLKSWSRIGGSHVLALAPPVPTSNKPLHCFCEHRFHNKSCDVRAWCPPVFSGGRRSFPSRFRYAFMPIQGNVIGENNSGFRQRRLVNLVRGLNATIVLERLCFS